MWIVEILNPKKVWHDALGGPDDVEPQRIHTVRRKYHTKHGAQVRAASILYKHRFSKHELKARVRREPIGEAVAG